MKYFALVLFISLLGCQPAPDSSPAPKGNESQAENPPGSIPPVPNLTITPAGDLSRPNAVTLSTVGLTKVEKTFNFQTDISPQYILDPADFQGTNCLDTPNVIYYWMQKTGSYVIQPQRPFYLNGNQAYQLLIRFYNVHCDGIDLRFAFRRVH